MGRKKIYTEEERKERRREFCKKWRENNKEKRKQWIENNKEIIKEKQKEWRENNKEKTKNYYENNKEKWNEYRKTKNGRALSLLNAYKIADKKYNRGECTLTTKWIVENIFSKSCAYCGESDWRKIGVDRKDSKLPHIPDNCVACCGLCNNKKRTKSYEEYMKEINKL